MTKTHKDQHGLLICDSCHSPLAWMQSSAGKWYLVTGRKVAIDTSTRYESSSRMDVVATTKVPHYRSCETFTRMEQMKGAL